MNMSTEPTVIIGFIRAALTLAIAFGIFLTDAQQNAIIVFAGALIALVGLFLSLWARAKVYAPATVDALTTEAYEDGLAAQVTNRP